MYLVLPGDMTLVMISRFLTENQEPVEECPNSYLRPKHDDAGKHRSEDDAVTKSKGHPV